MVGSYLDRKWYIVTDGELYGFVYRDGEMPTTYKVTKYMSPGSEWYDDLAVALTRLDHLNKGDVYCD